MDDEVAIAMVGTRKASPYAQEMGEKLAFQLAGLGAVVVSAWPPGETPPPTGALSGPAG